MTEQFSFFGNFTKVEDRPDGTLYVEGIASSEDRDKDGELVRASGMQKAIPGYLRADGTGPLREMHQLKASGNTTSIEVGDDKLTRISTVIVDSEAIKKVKHRVYQGFSIGGTATKRNKADPTIIEELELREISIVDVGANPKATFTLVKIAGGLPDDVAKDAGFAQPTDATSGLQAHDLEGQKKPVEKSNPEGHNQYTSAGAIGHAENAQDHLQQESDHRDAARADGVSLGAKAAHQEAADAHAKAAQLHQRAAAAREGQSKHGALPDHDAEARRARVASAAAAAASAEARDIGKAVTAEDLVKRGEIERDEFGRFAETGAAGGVHGEWGAHHARQALKHGDAAAAAQSIPIVATAHREAQAAHLEAERAHAIAGGLTGEAHNSASRHARIASATATAASREANSLFHAALDGGGLTKTTKENTVADKKIVVPWAVKICEDLRTAAVATADVDKVRASTGIFKASFSQMADGIEAIVAEECEELRAGLDDAALTEKAGKPGALKKAEMFALGARALILGQRHQVYVVDLKDAGEITKTLESPAFSAAMAEMRASLGKRGARFSASTKKALFDIHDDVKKAHDHAGMALNGPMKDAHENMGKAHGFLAKCNDGMAKLGYADGDGDADDAQADNKPVQGDDGNKERDAEKALKADLEKVSTERDLLKAQVTAIVNTAPEALKAQVETLAKVSGERDIVTKSFEHAQTAIAKLSKERTDLMADIEKFEKETAPKAIARISKLEGEKAEIEKVAKSTADTLAKVQAEKDAIEKRAKDAEELNDKANATLEKVLGEHQEIAKKLIKANAELATKGSLKAMPIAKKDDAAGGTLAPKEQQPETPSPDEVKKMPQAKQMEAAAELIKTIQSSGGMAAPAGLT